MPQIFGLFKPSYPLEQAINKLREKGLTGDKLTVVVMDAVSPGSQTLLDSMNRTDGMSLVDGIAIAASIGAVLGIIYGSVVYIGPVALGLIGMVAGGGAGYLLDRVIQKKRRAKPASSPGEIIVAVRCICEDEAGMAEAVMKEHHAISLGRGSWPPPGEYTTRSPSRSSSRLKK